MFLREYLYVDTDKVRGILSQLEEGIPETARQVERKEKDAEARNKMLGGFGRRSIDEESIEKSLGDSLFKILEDTLESIGILRDISSELPDLATSAQAHQEITPGSVVRITAPGTLFHPGQLADALVGIATAAQGTSQVLQSDVNDSQRQTGGNQRSGSKPKNQQPRAAGPVTGAPEDAMLYFPAQIPLLELSRDYLTGMIKFIRGMFGEGVHLHLKPSGKDGPVISARLESGRRFLDSTPEVLFSRYGVREQEWTVVGTVGQVGEIADGDTVSNPEIPEITDGESVNRAALVEFVGSFLKVAGNVGFVDMPTGTGFSVIPLAVYRAIGWSDDDLPAVTPGVGVSGARQKNSH